MKKEHDDEQLCDEVPYNPHGEYTDEEAARLDALFEQAEQERELQRARDAIDDLYEFQSKIPRASVAVSGYIAAINALFKGLHWFLKGDWVDLPVLTSLQYFGYARDVEGMLSPVYQGYNQILFFLLDMETWMALCVLVIIGAILLWVHYKIKIRRKIRMSTLIHESS